MERKRLEISRALKPVKGILSATFKLLIIASTTIDGSDRADDRRSRLLLLGAVATLLVCGGLLVYGSGRGYDLTDEVFYLIWTRDPQAYHLTYQPFGYLLHPLFEFLGGDLQDYRLSGFAAAM